MKLQHCLAALAAASLTALAGAAPVTYTFTGTVNSAEGGNVDLAFMLVMTGDTVNVSNNLTVATNAIANADYTLTIGGDGYTFNDADTNANLYVFNRLSSGEVGFGFAGTNPDSLVLDTAGMLMNYALDTTVAPPVGNGLVDESQNFMTITGTGGLTTLDFASLSNFKFSAEVQSSGVPEPGSFALAGLALVGLTLSARRRA